jgi:hypothetical protein
MDLAKAPRCVRWHPEVRESPAREEAKTREGSESVSQQATLVGANPLHKTSINPFMRQS